MKKINYAGAGATNSYQKIQTGNTPLRAVLSNRAMDVSVVLGSAGIGEVETGGEKIGQLPIVVSAVEENEGLRKLAEERLTGVRFNWRDGRRLSPHRNGKSYSGLIHSHVQNETTKANHAMDI